MRVWILLVYARRASKPGDHAPQSEDPWDLVTSQEVSNGRNI